ncbi:hypothetical protein HDV05_006217 [Chytridiales sp. JEL 0842]|nr:hypothetical protein HDV05_006217 [Chytridiales sp. JEL 0842]
MRAIRRAEENTFLSKHSDDSSEDEETMSSAGSASGDEQCSNESDASGSSVEDNDEDEVSNGSSEDDDGDEEEVEDDDEVEKASNESVDLDEADNEVGDLEDEEKDQESDEENEDPDDDLENDEDSYETGSGVDEDDYQDLEETLLQTRQVPDLEDECSEDDDAETSDHAHEEVMDMDDNKVEGPSSDANIPFTEQEIAPVIDDDDDDLPKYEYKNDDEENVERRESDEDHKEENDEDAEEDEVEEDFEENEDEDGDENKELLLVDVADDSTEATALDHQDSQDALDQAMPESHEVATICSDTARLSTVFAHDTVPQSTEVSEAPSQEVQESILHATINLGSLQSQFSEFATAAPDLELTEITNHLPLDTSPEALESLTEGQTETQEPSGMLTTIQSLMEDIIEEEISEEDSLVPSETESDGEKTPRATLLNSTFHPSRDSTIRVEVDEKTLVQHAPMLHHDDTLTELQDSLNPSGEEKVKELPTMEIRLSSSEGVESILFVQTTNQPQLEEDTKTCPPPLSTESSGYFTAKEADDIVEAEASQQEVSMDTSFVAPYAPSAEGSPRTLRRQSTPQRRRGRSLSVRRREASQPYDDVDYDKLKLREYEKTIDALRKQNEALENEVQQKSTDAEETAEMMKRVLCVLKDTLSAYGPDSLASDNDSNETANGESSRDLVKDLNETAERLAEDVKLVRHQLVQSQNSVESYKNDVENAKAVTESLKQQFLSNLRQESLRVMELRASYDSSQEEIRSLKETLANSQTEKLDLQKNIESLSVEHEETKLQMATLEREQQKSLTGLKAEKSKLETDVSKLVSDNQVLQTDIAHLQKERAKLAQHLEEALEKESMKYEKILKEFQAKEEATKKTAEQLKAELDASRVSFKAAKEAIESYKTQEQNLKSNVYQMAAEKDAALAKADVLHQILPIVQVERTELKSEVEKLTQISGDLQTMLVVKDEKISNLSDKCELIGTKLNTTGDILSNMHTAILSKIDECQADTDYIRQNCEMMDKYMPKIDDLPSMKAEIERVRLNLEQYIQLSETRHKEVQHLFTNVYDASHQEIAKNQALLNERDLELAKIHMSLQAEVSTLQQAMETSKQMAHKRIEELKESLKNAELLLSVEKTQSEALKAQVSELKELISVEKLSNASLSRQTEDLSSQLNEWKLKHITLQKDNLQESKTISALLLDAQETYQSQTSLFHKTAEILTKQLETLSSDASKNAIVQQEQLQSILTESGKERSALVAKVDSLQTLLASQIDTIQVMEKGLDQEKSKSQTLEAEIVALKNSLESHIQLNKTVINELEAIHSENERKNQEAITLLGKLADAQKHIQALEEFVEANAVKIDALREAEENLHSCQQSRIKELLQELEEEKLKSSQIQIKYDLVESEVLAERTLSETLLAELNFINQKGHCLTHNDTSSAVPNGEDLRPDSLYGVPMSPQDSIVDFQRQNAANNAILKAQLHNSHKNLTRLEQLVQVLTEEKEGLRVEVERVRFASTEVIRQISRMAEALELANARNCPITMETFEWMVAKITELMEQNRVFTYKTRQLEELAFQSLEKGKQLANEKMAEESKKDQIINRLQRALEDSASVVGRKRIQFLVSKNK